MRHLVVFYDFLYFTQYLYFVMVYVILRFIFEARNLISTVIIERDNAYNNMSLLDQGVRVCDIHIHFMNFLFRH